MWLADFRWNDLNLNVLVADSKGMRAAKLSFVLSAVTTQLCKLLQWLTVSYNCLGDDRPWIEWWRFWWWGLRLSVCPPTPARPSRRPRRGRIQWRPLLGCVRRNAELRHWFVGPRNPAAFFQAMTAHTFTRVSGFSSHHAVSSWLTAVLSHFSAVRLLLAEIFHVIMVSFK